MKNECIDMAQVEKKASEAIGSENQANQSSDFSESKDESDHEEVLATVCGFSPYFSTLVDNKDDVEDLTLDVYRNILQHIQAHPNWRQEIENFGAYIMQIARNRVKGNWRKYQSNLHDSIDDNADDKRPRDLSDNLAGVKEIDRKLMLEKQRQLLNFILSRLSSYERYLIVMNKIERYTTKEIAAELGTDYRIVQSDVNSAWTKFKYHAKTMVNKKQILDILT
ncbi:MAG: sigma-70 family RNA polymerase sigma factor [Acidobacteriota bacterium]|nr:sigma-70 family RNA polymerase sigma factor [Acidobacteriota bacterium]